MSDAPIEGVGSPDGPEPVTPDVTQGFTEEELLALAVEIIQAKAPEWTPRAGSQEVIVLEAMATLLTSLTFTMEQVPARVVEHLMRMYGVVRDEGAPARAVARFEVAGSQSIYRVPEGTTLRAMLGSTGESVDFTTDGRLEIEASQGWGAVSITAADTGEQSNGLPVGMNLDVVDNLIFVERVTLEEASTGGRGVESDASFESRSASLLERQVSTLVLPNHFTNAALAMPGVGRAVALDLFDPTVVGGEPGDNVGHVTVAVADNQGEPLLEVQREEIREELMHQALASLVLHVVDPEYTDVDVSVTVRAASASDVEELPGRVEDRLARWLSPTQWSWGGSVSQYAMVAEVARVPGVAEVIEASESVDLVGFAPLPRVGNISVTVVER